MRFFKFFNRKKKEQEQPVSKQAIIERLDNSIVHVLKQTDRNSVPAIPTVNELTELTTGLEDADVFNVISTIATYLCEARARTLASRTCTTQDTELAEWLFKRWEKCRMKDSQANQKFVSQTPRDELIRMLREIVEHTGAYVRRNEHNQMIIVHLDESVAAPSNMKESDTAMQQTVAATPKDKWRWWWRK